MIEIKFPATITLDEGNCTLLNAVNAISVASNCSVTGNQISLFYPFGPSGTYITGRNAFSFVLSTYGKNPAFGRDAGAFTINTYEFDGTLKYLIDTREYLAGIYKPTSSGLAASLNVLNTTANAFPVDYQFIITLNSEVPTGSIVNITLPRDVQL